MNAHKHQMKSYQYDVAELAELGRRLNSIAFGMSFAKLELQVIDTMTLWIKKQFGDVSMQEIALAFELVTAKKLPMGKNEGRHYAKFDMQYVGDVLHAFKTYRGRQLKMYEEQKKIKELQEGNFENISGQEMYEGIKRISLKDGKLMRAADWGAAFLYAESEGLIDKMTNDEKDMYVENVRADIKEKASTGHNPRPLLDILRTDESIASECRKRIIQDHFQKMINDNKVQEEGD